MPENIPGPVYYSYVLVATTRWTTSPTTPTIDCLNKTAKLTAQAYIEPITQKLVTNTLKQGLMGISSVSEQSAVRSEKEIGVTKTKPT